MTSASRVDFNATATGLHLCQRCPRLLAYQKKGEQDAWRVGIAGGKGFYGKIFHRHITGRFHADAASPKNPYRSELAMALQAGEAELKARLGMLIRTRYFTPFLLDKSQNLTADTVVALARATGFWVECLANFLSKVPSLLASPETRMGMVFHQPEKTLRLPYRYADGQKLWVSGRYDCLLFNPDAARAVVFEFKGFNNSDSTVELSQTLIYAWLIAKITGIVPAIKLIYLENEKPLDVSPVDVKKMMNNLPHLFDVGRQVLEKRLPLPVAPDSSLCENCPYDARCDKDWGNRHAVPDKKRLWDWQTTTLWE